VEGRWEGKRGRRGGRKEDQERGTIHTNNANDFENQEKNRNLTF
jgi:hypothetical protein